MANGKKKSSASGRNLHENARLWNLFAEPINGKTAREYGMGKLDLRSHQSKKRAEPEIDMDALETSLEKAQSGTKSQSSWGNRTPAFRTTKYRDVGGAEDEEYYLTESGQKSWVPQEEPETAEASYKQFWDNYVSGWGRDLGSTSREQWQQYGLDNPDKLKDQETRFKKAWETAGSPFMKQLSLQQFIDKDLVFTDTDDEGKQTHRGRAHFKDALPDKEGLNLWETLKNPFETGRFELKYDETRVPTDTVYTSPGSTYQAQAEFAHSYQHANKTQEEVNEMNKRFSHENQQFGDYDEEGRGKYGRIGALEWLAHSIYEQEFENYYAGDTDELNLGKSKGMLAAFEDPYSRDYSQGVWDDKSLVYQEALKAGYDPNEAQKAWEDDPLSYELGTEKWSKQYLEKKAKGLKKREPFTVERRGGWTPK